MPFLDECYILGGMCHFLSNVTLLEDYVIFGGMCNFGINVPFLDINAKQF